MGSTAEVSHGVVGLGDSFMKGYGLPVGGISCTSWASWLAWALTTCCTQHAVDGASCEQVLRDQIPLLRGADYQLGLIWVGANDLAQLEHSAFAERVAAVCVAARQRCDIVAIASLPAALTTLDAAQRKHDQARHDANALIRVISAETGCVLVELEQALEVPWAMAQDGRHPTALGQLAAARTAAAALHMAGLSFNRHLPDAAGLGPTRAERERYWPAPRSRSRHVASLLWQAVQERAR